MLSGREVYRTVTMDREKSGIDGDVFAVNIIIV